MVKIYLEHETSLSIKEIKEKANDLIEESLEKFRKHISNLQKDWEGNTLVFSFKAKGFLILGRVIIEDNLIKVEAKIPLAALPFKKKIKRKFHEKARELFP